MTSGQYRSWESVASAAVLIPALNESQTIASVIAGVKKEVNFPIFVIDDASTDDTILIAERAGANVIPLAARLGSWGATQTGLRYALRHGYEFVVTMDADGQHMPGALGALIRPMLKGRADVIIGSCTERGSWGRQVAWLLMKKFSGLTYQDITSGFRVYNYAALREASGWRATLLDYQDIGVLLLLQSRGLKIMDVSVPMSPRINDKSRIFHSWVMVCYYMCQTLALGLSKRQVARKQRCQSSVGE